jgi:hypothetical protein
MPVDRPLASKGQVCFHCLASVEIDRFACETLRMNRIADDTIEGGIGVTYYNVIA